MRNFLVLLGVVALIALAVAAPGRGRKGGRKGRKGPPLHEKLCRVVYGEVDGQTKSDYLKDCPKPFNNEIFDCEQLDLTKVRQPRNKPVPEVLQGAQEIYVCKPKKCENDGQCVAGGVCTNERPEKEEGDGTQVAENQCRLGRQRRPKPTATPTPQPPTPQPPTAQPPPPPEPLVGAVDVEVDGETTPPREKRCRYPKQYKLLAKACLLKEGDADVTADAGISKDCTCNTSASCQLEAFGKTLDVSFCEKRPRGNRGGSESQSGDGTVARLGVEGSGDAEGNAEQDGGRPAKKAKKARKAKKSSGGSRRGRRQ